MKATVRRILIGEAYWWEAFRRRGDLLAGGWFRTWREAYDWVTEP